MGVTRLAFALAAIAAVASANMNNANVKMDVAIYNIDLDAFQSIEVRFVDAVSTEVSKYCSTSEKCPLSFRSGNLTTEIKDRRPAKPYINITIVIMSENNEQLSANAGKEAFKSKHEAIDTAIGERIASVNEEFFGILPDNPTNWIMIPVFVVITLVLLLVVIYLSKHKVNHVEEHYEQMNEKPNGTADGEVAA